MPFSLSVLIPVHNEERTLSQVLDRVEARAEVSEIVIVDDGSTDRTPQILATRRFLHPTKVIRHERNMGKGSAIRTALAAAECQLALVQDADLEYDPADYPALLAPFERPDVTVVYGTRSFSAHSAYSFWFVMGNKLVTHSANVLFNTYLSDLESGYKVMPLVTWRSLGLRSNGFDLEPEITAKLLSRGHRIFEVPISYVARSREDGKKLRWQDGVQALWTLASLRAADGRRSRRPAEAGGRLSSAISGDGRDGSARRTAWAGDGTANVRRVA
jgi:glycosyltransferase involved in cell wall biosynthesis